MFLPVFRYMYVYPEKLPFGIKQCKFRNFCDYFIFINRVKWHICDIKNSPLGHDLPISVNDRYRVISRGFYFRENKTLVNSLYRSSENIWIFSMYTPKIIGKWYQQCFGHTKTNYVDTQTFERHEFWAAALLILLLFVCFIWFFTSQSTLFQLCRDRSSSVEPVLSKDQSILLKDTTQWRQWGSNPRPLCRESSTLPLSHCALFTHFALQSHMIWINWLKICAYNWNAVQVG